MTDKKTLAKAFIFSLFLAVLSISWFIFDIASDMGLIFKKISCQFALMMTFLSVSISAISFQKLLMVIRHDINRRKEKEKNVRDLHQYIQLLNQPDMIRIYRCSTG